MEKENSDIFSVFLLNLDSDMQIGTHIYADGGSPTFVRSTAEAGKSANLNIADSATGCYHGFYFYVNGRLVTSGLTFSSSNPSVLTYVTMLGNFAGFYSCRDGRTELEVNYGGNTYKFIVSISDRNSAQFQQCRETVYRSLGLNSGMPRQYVCYLLAAWICDHTVYDPTVINRTGTAGNGIDVTYKDYFRHGVLVCSGYADPVFPCTDTRFDGCIQEQISLQTQKNTLVSDRSYAKYSGLTPWVTGNWVNY